eukprot:gnl/Chilomastix_cuspidata/4460.p1 GENE.gnl/Chilomastix_cuspidata/4460~~gnl/Chilomastix_cuspidata/4460.p1  ORF type:complete len:1220 (+),score=544.85 gnl/Chilomastix_cuspidata/4460:192-3851(+)
MPILNGHFTVFAPRELHDAKKPYWKIPFTGELFKKYPDFLEKMWFYQQRIFHPLGDYMRAPTTFKEALDLEKAWAQATCKKLPAFQRQLIATLAHGSTRGVEETVAAVVAHSADSFSIAEPVFLPAPPEYRGVLAADGAEGGPFLLGSVLAQWRSGDILTDPTDPRVGLEVGRAGAARRAVHVAATLDFDRARRAFVISADEVERLYSALDTSYVLVFVPGLPLSAMCGAAPRVSARALRCAARTITHAHLGGAEQLQSGVRTGRLQTSPKSQTFPQVLAVSAASLVKAFSPVGAAVARDVVARCFMTMSVPSTRLTVLSGAPCMLRRLGCAVWNAMGASAGDCEPCNRENAFLGERQVRQRARRGLATFLNFTDAADAAPHAQRAVTFSSFSNFAVRKARAQGALYAMKHPRLLMQFEHQRRVALRGLQKFISQTPQLDAFVSGRPRRANGEDPQQKLMLEAQLALSPRASPRGRAPKVLFPVEDTVLPSVVAQNPEQPQPQPLPPLDSAGALLLGAGGAGEDADQLAGTVLQLWDFLTVFHDFLHLGRSAAPGDPRDALDAWEPPADGSESDADSSVSEGGVWEINPYERPPDKDVEDVPDAAPGAAVAGRIPRCFTLNAFLTAIRRPETDYPFNVGVNPLLYAVLCRLTARLMRAEEKVEHSDTPEHSDFGLPAAEFRRRVVDRACALCGRPAASPEPDSPEQMPSPTVTLSRGPPAKRQPSRRRAAQRVREMGPLSAELEQEASVSTSAHATSSGDETSSSVVLSFEDTSTRTSDDEEPQVPRKRRRSGRLQKIQELHEANEEAAEATASVETVEAAREPRPEVFRQGSTSLDWCQVLGDYIDQLTDADSVRARQVLAKVGYEPAQPFWLARKRKAAAPRHFVSFESLPLAEKLVVLRVLLREVADARPLDAFFEAHDRRVRAHVKAIGAQNKRITGWLRKRSVSLRAKEDAEAVGAANDSLAESEAACKKLNESLTGCTEELARLRGAEAVDTEKKRKRDISTLKQQVNRLKKRLHRERARAEALRAAADGLPHELAVAHATELFRARRRLVRHSCALQALHDCTHPLGSDRYGRIYFGFPSILSHIFAVDGDGRWSALPFADIDTFLDALDARGLRERALKKALATHATNQANFLELVEGFIADYARPVGQPARQVPALRRRQSVNAWLREALPVVAADEDIRFINSRFAAEVGRLRVGTAPFREFLGTRAPQ